MTGTMLTKFVLILLCINILLYLGGVRVIDSSNDFMGRFVNTSTNVSVSGDLQNVQSDLKSLSATGGVGSGILSFIDVLDAVKSFAIFIINLIFTPFGLFISLPGSLGLMIGLPLTVIGLLGIAYFMRSGG